MAALLAATALSNLLDVKLPPLPGGGELKLTEGLNHIGEASTRPSGRLVTSTTTADDAAAADVLSPGGTVWPCAAALCRWLESNANLRSASVLELGSGTGVGGLYAAGLGAREVLLTDGRAGLAELQRANIRQNEHLLPDPARIACAQLRWGSDAPPPGPWDWVVGSGCTVEVADETMVALAATCAALLRPNGAPPPRLILAHDHRPNPDARGDVEPLLDGVDGAVGDENLRLFAVAASREGLGLRQLRYERPTEEERARGRFAVSVLEVLGGKES